MAAVAREANVAGYMHQHEWGLVRSQGAFVVVTSERCLVCDISRMAVADARVWLARFHADG